VRRAAVAGGGRARRVGAWRPLPLQAALLPLAGDARRGRPAAGARGVRRAVYVHLFRMAQYVSRPLSRPYRILDLTDAISGEVARALCPTGTRCGGWSTGWSCRASSRYERAMVRPVRRDVGHQRGGSGRRWRRRWGQGVGRRRPAAAQPAGGGQRGGDGALPAAGAPGGGAGAGVRGPHGGVPQHVDAAVRLAGGDPAAGAGETVPGARLELIGDGAGGAGAGARRGWPGVNVRGHVVDLNAALNEADGVRGPVALRGGGAEQGAGGDGGGAAGGDDELR
jgi:hypothetical protein